MLRDALVFLEDMLECAGRVREYTHGLDLESFRANRMAFDAVLRNLEVLGEAAKGVPPDMRTRHPDIPWRSIAGLRDVLIHQYFGLEDETLWDVVENKIPELVQSLERLLAESRNQ